MAGYHQYTYIFMVILPFSNRILFPVFIFEISTLSTQGISDIIAPTATTVSHSLFTIPAGAITSWDWDFGDGRTASGPAVQHPFDTVGVYTVRLTVTDNRGASDPTTLTVDPSREPPPPGSSRGWTCKRGSRRTSKGRMPTPKACSP